MAAYREFAKVYDLLMGGRNAYDWPAYLLSLLKTYGVLPPQKVLDAGCGTGHISLALMEKGYRVTGLDLSAAMLDQAARNAHERGLFLPLIEADMLDMPHSGRVQAITCACDPVNYLKDEAEVSRFFHSAHGKLSPDGVLLFDVCTPYYYQNVLASGCYASVEPQAAYILQTFSEEHICRMLLTLFIQQLNGTYARDEEEHVLTAFTKETLMDLLGKTGFKDIRAYGFGTLKEAADMDERWQIAAVRA